jgi:hypothetical protein
MSNGGAQGGVTTHPHNAAASPTWDLVLRSTLNHWLLWFMSNPIPLINRVSVRACRKEGQLSIARTLLAVSLM